MTSPSEADARWRRLSPAGLLWASTGAVMVAFVIVLTGWRSACRPSYVLAAGGFPEAVAAQAQHLGGSADVVCARCHTAIYKSYEQTPMAQGSGSADEIALGAAQGGFTHAKSGVHYEVFSRGGTDWMSFAREVQYAASAASKGSTDKDKVTKAPALRGEHALAYFVGFGRHGRTYLYQVEGRWFELPINFYTRRQVWDMAPAFDEATSMPANLPTDPNCLHCHATSVAASLPDARNHFAAAPFAQGGVGCAACHGDASRHVASNGQASIFDPAHASAAIRDSTCLQCHLEGDAVVYRAGKSLAAFTPGEDLAATAVYFVRESRVGGGGRAASQYEALLRSACKRAAGDRLTCTTCHDPHASTAAAERVAYYRGKCLQCHTSPVLAASHHPEQPDCASCHMPTRATVDISHEQATDHDIEARPSHTSRAPVAGERLLPVGGWQAGDRELGLAYAQLASHGDRVAGERALTLLARAELGGADDAVLHTQLGFLQQLSGDRAGARAQYAAALRENAYEPSALANLAVLEAGAGEVSQAIGHLEQLFAADPSQTPAGLNLAFIQCRLGQGERSLQTLDTLARYNPDDPALRRFRWEGEYGGQHCALPSSAGAPKEHSMPSSPASGPATSPSGGASHAVQ